MVEKATFYSRFKLLIILTNLSTTYVPGLGSFRKCNQWMLFSILGALLPAICGLDAMAIAFFGGLTTIESIGAVFLACSFLWNSIKRLLFLNGSPVLVKALSYFDAELEPPFWPEVRENNFNKYYRKIMKTAFISGTLVLGPMFCVFITKLFWTKLLFFRSFFDMENYFEETDLRIILFQGVAILVLNASWIMSEAYLAVLMCIIISEYEYLTYSFQKMFAVINKPQKVTTKDLALFRKQLGLWITYHGKVIKFTRLVESFFVPIFAASLTSITVNFIGNIFNSITVKMPFDVACLTYVYALPRILMTFVLCRYGDRINSLSVNLFGKNIPTHLAELPTDVMKSLVVIGEITRRTSQIRVNQNVRLDSATFRKLLYVLYRFATFLQEMKKHGKNI